MSARRPVVRSRAGRKFPRRPTISTAATTNPAPSSTNGSGDRDGEQQRAQRRAEEGLPERLLDGQQAVRAVELRTVDDLRQQRAHGAVVHRLGQAQDERHRVQRRNPARAGQHERGQRGHGRAARTTFAAAIARRRSTRSTSAPLGSANSSHGRNAKVTRPEIVSGLRV